MTTLDEPMGYIDPNEVSPRSTAMRYGMIWALFSILLGLITYLMGWTDPSSSLSAGSILTSIISIALNITMLVLAIKYHRDKELGGFISFGRGFKTGMLTTLVFAVIATVWALIFFNFIATDMIDGIQDAMVEKWEEQGLSDEQIEQAQSYTGFMSSPAFMVGATFVGSLIWGAILSLIVSAVLKKDQPQTA